MKIVNLVSTLFFVIFLNLSCSDKPKHDKSLDGKSIDFIIESFGKPDSENEFILTKNIYEYQYGLLVIYPDPEGKNIKIKELGWKTKFNEKFVWFYKIENNWISIDNIYWNPILVTF